MNEEKTTGKGKFIIAILVILFVAVVYLIWESSEIQRFTGTYEAVGDKDSAYELTLFRTGRIKVVDIGAGNPALEGFLYRTPLSAKDGKYIVKAGGETNPVYLNLGDSGMRANGWLSMILREDRGDSEFCKIIVLETGTEHMQFEKIE